MPRWPQTIMAPLHVHGVRTEAEYRQQQRDKLAQARHFHPQFEWPDPWESKEVPTVFVAGGKWLVKCDCGNYPSVHPDWRLALCFECGAIYEGLTMPDNAEDIEAVLVERPHPANRAWLPSETVNDLIAQNVEHGVTVPARLQKEHR